MTDERQPTPRQADALALRATGASYRHIGHELGISRQAAWGLCNPARANTASRLRRRRGHQDAIRAAGVALVAEAKRGGCFVCGRGSGRSVHLHHVEPGDKLFTISEWFVGRGNLTRAGLDRLRAELAKCEPRCARCHNRVHAIWRRRDTLIVVTDNGRRPTVERRRVPSGEATEGRP